MTKAIFYVAAAATILSACSSEGEHTSYSPEGQCNLTIRANASSNELTFPITIAAFNNSEKVHSQEIANSGSSTTMTLQKGSYTITASSGNNDFSNGYATAAPLMMAVKEVTLNDNTELALSMSYRVAQVSVSLSDIEEEVTGISVTFSTLYADISEKGELSGSISPTIDCTKTDEGVWTTGTLYVLPSTDANTKFTITKKYADQEKQYDVTIGESLDAGNIYNFKGKYDDTYAKYNLQLTLTTEGWQETKDKSFTFNDNEGTITTPDTPSGDNDNPSTGETLTAGTVWNGHIVALVEGNTATLLSTKEWENVSSLPTDEISAYTEGEYSGWSVPTVEQGQAIAKAYPMAGGATSKLTALNTELAKNNLTEIYNSTKKDVRYLCDEGNQAYSFKNTSYIVGNGSNSYEYHLRLVKTITIK